MLVGEDGSGSVPQVPRRGAKGPGDPAPREVTQTDRARGHRDAGDEPERTFPGTRKVRTGNDSASGTHAGDAEGHGEQRHPGSGGGVGGRRRGATTVVIVPPRLPGAVR